jgi:enoyl-CoA hydratase/carnithine racemase
MELAGRIAELPKVAVQSVKRAVSAGLASPLDEGLEIERREFLRVAKTEDATEGPMAFLERRRPSFSHR